MSNKTMMYFIITIMLIITIRAATAQGNIDNSHYNSPKVIVKLWKSHMKHAKASGTAWMDAIIGNGTPDKKHMNKKRNTLIYVPEKHDNSIETDIIIWLHGHNGFNKFYKRILRHIPDIYRNGGNPIIIALELPWSHWTRTRTSRNGTGPFSNFEEYLLWKAAVLKILKEKFNILEERISKNIIAYGHSAGGSALKSMAITGALRDIAPSTIIFSDSTYANWLDETYDYFIKYHPETKVYLLTAKGGSPRRHAKRFLKNNPKAGKTVFHLKMPNNWTHKMIGDNCVLFSAKYPLFMSLVKKARLGKQTKAKEPGRVF